MEKDQVSPVPQSRERHLMCDLLIFRKLLRGHLMYTGKGSIQEVMGLPPRSVTNPGTLATWGSLPVAFQKPLSQRGHKEKSLVKYDLQMWSLACMLFFLQFEFKDFREKGERATRLLLPQPPLTFLCCQPGLQRHLCLMPPLYSATCKPGAKCTVLFRTKEKEVFSLCLYRVIPKGTTDLPCPRIDNLMNVLAHGLFAYCSMFSQEAPSKRNNASHLVWESRDTERMAKILWIAILPTLKIQFCSWISSHSSIELQRGLKGRQGGN